MCFSFDQINIDNRVRQSTEFKAIVKIIKSDILKMLALAKSGHPGGAIGISDLMAVLFFGNIMRYNSNDPNWEGRDRFILSAGHYAPVLYSCLARASFFPIEELTTLRKLGSRLQGHPANYGILPGIETTSGSLGQGISIAIGMAMNNKLIEKNDSKIFCLTGDGELQEGSCWEAAMSAGMYHLNNLCWIVDNNDCQIDGRVKDVMSIYPLAEKFSSFGFNVIEIDGHNYEEILSAFNQFLHTFDRPTCIIAKTFMGNGISFMHNKFTWHGNPPSMEQAKIALAELDEIYN